MRKFAARRVTSNDIFNYRSSMTKVSGGSELILPTGADNTPAINIETIPAADTPMNTDLLDKLRAEAINSTPVPAIMVQNGGVTEIEFSKETELANTRFRSFISSTKIDMNRDITQLYRKILRWETDIDPVILQDLKFVFHMPSAETLKVTSGMISDFNSFWELAYQTILTKKEQEPDDKADDISNIMRTYKKKLITKYLPQVDVEELEKLANEARQEVNQMKLEETIAEKNLIDDADLEEEEGGE
jgi:hypothetical protein